MQQIKLTNQDAGETVFAGDLKLTDAIICCHYAYGIGLLCKDGEGVSVKWAKDGGESMRHKDILEIVSAFGQWRTLDNRRIVTERELTVDDLKDTDHVGILMGDYKWFAVCTGNGFSIISFDEPQQTGKCTYTYNGLYYQTIKDCIKSLASLGGKIVYRFDTYSEMFKWLAQ